jgi:putative addiction module killer protein
LEQGNFGESKPVGDGVIERRIAFDPGYRVYFGRDGATLVILLGGGTKQRQDRDIEKAKCRWDDYQRRKQGLDPKSWY